MSESIDILLPVLARAYEPPPDEPIWQWAEKNLRLVSSQNAEHAGQPWSLSRAPHTRLIFDFLADPVARELHIMKSSASMFTTALFVALAWLARYKPCRVLYCINNIAEVGKVSHSILQPFLRQVFGDQVFDDRSQSRDFLRLPTGAIFELGSPTEGFFANKQASVVILDEFDIFPDSLEGGATEPLSAARGRFKASTRFAKLITLCAPQRQFDIVRKDISQPGTKQHRAYLSGDQREYRIPCPHCDAEFAPGRTTLHFEHLRLPEAESVEGELMRETPYDMARVLRETALQCPACNGLIHEGWGPKDKAALVRRGRWVPTNLTAPPDRWSAWYNDTCALMGNSELGKLAAELIDARSKGRHDLIQVCRARFGEPQSEIDTVDLSADHVRRHCASHRRGVCPVLPWFIGLSIDCQKGPSETHPLLFKWVKAGIMDNGEIHVIDYGQTASPQELRLVYEQGIPYSGPPIPGSDGKPVMLYCQRAIIDSGYRAGADAATEEDLGHHIYPLCVSWGFRDDGRWLRKETGYNYTGTWHLVPMKGRGRDQIRGEATQFSTVTVPHPQFGQIELPLHLFNDPWFKSELYHGTLAADPTTPLDPRLRRYPRIYLPSPEDEIDEQFLNEISSEKLMERPKRVRGQIRMGREWGVPSHRKNDFGDCVKMLRVLWSLMSRSALQSAENEAQAPALTARSGHEAR